MKNSSGWLNNRREQRMEKRVKSEVSNGII